MSGKERIAASWPPDPGAIDLSDPDWCTIKQAADIARVTSRTIRNWMAAEDIAVKLRGRVWVSRQRLMALIHSVS